MTAEEPPELVRTSPSMAEEGGLVLGLSRGKELS